MFNYNPSPKVLLGSLALVLGGALAILDWRLSVGYLAYAATMITVLHYV